MAGNTADETISFYVDQSAPVVSIASQPSTPTLLPTFSLDTDEDGTLSLTGGLFVEVHSYLDRQAFQIHQRVLFAIVEISRASA